jgi:hypothetical protein
VPINKKQKLGPKIIDCVFLGYAIHSVGYRFLILSSSVPEMVVDTIMESRAIFFEDEFSIKNNTPSMSGHESISIPDSVPIPETNEPAIHGDVETHEEILEEDNNTVARKSKREGCKILW